MKQQTSLATKEEHYFDEAAADHAVNFFEKHLRHVKGKWAGTPFILMDWQKNDIIRPLFGWKRSDGTRKYRTAYIEIPRKNGKSTLAAGIALYLLFADREAGGEVYSAAGDREQAAIVFNMAADMVARSKPLRNRAKVYKRSIYVPRTNSSYNVLSADAPTKHGLNAHGIVFDELHVQPDRELWDVLTTSTAARIQPLVVAITTAGYDRESICYEMHDYAKRVQSGIIEDSTFFSYIAAADEKDDWKSPEVWATANPGLGESVQLDYLEQEAKKAEQIPAYQNTFRRLHLNQWTSQDSRWLDMSAWDESAGEVDAEALRGKACYAGLDMANTTDVAAFVLVFPPQPGIDAYKVLPYFWIPGANVFDRVKRDRVPYDAWIRQGHISATEGDVIDYATIRAKIEQLYEVYNIREVAYDRWGAVQLTQELEAQGMTIVPFGQGYASMSSPTKELLNLVLKKQLHHGKNPVLRWMADNVSVKQDPAGNIKPDKQKSREKIDGIVATIMGLDRAIRNEGFSIYEERGAIEL